MLSQVMIGPFLLRVLSLPKYKQLVPSSLLSKLQAETPSFWNWAQIVTANESVTAIWDEDLVIMRTMERLAKMHNKS